MLGQYLAEWPSLHPDCPVFCTNFCLFVYYSQNYDPVSEGEEAATNSVTGTSPSIPGSWLAERTRQRSPTAFRSHVSAAQCQVHVVGRWMYSETFLERPTVWKRPDIPGREGLHFGITEPVTKDHLLVTYIGTSVITCCRFALANGRLALVCTVWNPSRYSLNDDIMTATNKR